MADGGFGTIYEATWKDGPIHYWDSENNQWRRRHNERRVALKCLHDSKDITVEFLSEVCVFPIIINYIIHLYINYNFLLA